MYNVIMTRVANVLLSHTCLLIIKKGITLKPKYFFVLYKEVVLSAYVAKRKILQDGEVLIAVIVGQAASAAVEHGKVLL